METMYDRTLPLMGEQGVEKIKRARVALFGVGGVGGACAEALARSGVGSIDLFDGDKVSVSNINRQVVALHSSVGRPKAEVMAERIRDINPACNVRAFNLFIDGDTIGGIDFSSYDCVLDAVDTVSAKVMIIERAKLCGVHVISCMGAGNKIDISAFKVADISKTSVCPLARAVRTALKKRGIAGGVQAVFSTEQPSGRVVEEEGSTRHIPASNAFAPVAAGLALARGAVLYLMDTEKGSDR